MRAIVPSVKAVRVPAPYSCYVAIEQRVSGQAKNAILAVLGADMYIKRVVVVDHDVNIFDDREVAWALGTRCQADRDIMVISNTRGSDLDPSTDSDGYTRQVGRRRHGQTFPGRVHAPQPHSPGGHGPHRSGCAGTLTPVSLEYVHEDVRDGVAGRTR